MPIHVLCSTCKFGATHICRKETFTNESMILLGHMSISYNLTNFDSNSRVGNLKLKLYSTKTLFRKTFTSPIKPFD